MEEMNARKKKRSGGHQDNAYRYQYNCSHYERLSVHVRKGDRVLIKEMAAESGMSVNAYINQLIEKDVARRARKRNLNIAAYKDAMVMQANK